MAQNNNNLIEVNLPNGKVISIPQDTPIKEIIKPILTNDSSVVGVRADNFIRELNFCLTESCKLDLIDLLSKDGRRIYKRSLYFLLVKAVFDLFPERKVIISHSIGNGVYCEVKGQTELTSDEVNKIQDRMLQLIESDIPFIKKILPLDEAKEMFLKSNRMDKYYAIVHRKKAHVTIYSCDGYDDYFYGYMVPSTSYLKVFNLIFYSPGLVLLLPEKNNPSKVSEFKEQKKLINIFTEYKKWGQILEVNNIGAINNLVEQGKISELIRIAEALHEKKIAQIADMICNSQAKKKIVLISGPSSSGKTTFAQRLYVQLRVNGLKPITISLDDYFVDRDHTPKDANGDYDFEALEAIDIELFNEHLSSLINGGEVEIPIFNFKRGCRDPIGKKLKIDNNQLIIIEGIHALNEKLTFSIPKDDKFKIYISALTALNIDDHNNIPTTDTRFIRRIVRDYQFRGNDAKNSISRWPSVGRGEEKNIFPFQENADVMFNSSLIFELGILKSYAEPLLAAVDENCIEYLEAKRLIEFLSYSASIDSKEIPGNSILREFIGESVFYK